MRAQILAVAMLACGAIAVAIVSCRTASAPPGATLPAGTTSARVSPSSTSEPSSKAPTGSLSANDAAATDDDVAKIAACNDPRAVVLNHPDGGTVFNNALTSADAGFIDRTQGVLDAIANRSQAFRCCFDPWLEQAPSGEGQLLLRVTLAPNGDVSAAEIDSARSDIRNATSVACVLAVARGIDYPPSPTKKETIVEYPFRVGAAGR
jgi:hypothetical protein